jgi:hypothetical protein
MRSKPATWTASVRGFLFCHLSPLGRDDRLGPTAPRPAKGPRATFAEANCRSMISRSPRQPLRWPAALSRYKSRMGRRPQRPGNQPARRRRFWRIPRQLTLENCRLAAGSAAIIQQIQECSRFRCETLSARSFSAAIKKLSSSVQNLWMMRLPCGNERKTKKVAVLPWSLGRSRPSKGAPHPKTRGSFRV